MLAFTDYFFSIADVVTRLRLFGTSLSSLGLIKTFEGRRNAWLWALHRVLHMSQNYSLTENAAHIIKWSYRILHVCSFVRVRTARFTNILPEAHLRGGFSPDLNACKLPAENRTLLTRWTLAERKEEAFFMGVRYAVPEVQLAEPLFRLKNNKEEAIKSRCFPKLTGFPTPPQHLKLLCHCFSLSSMSSPSSALGILPLQTPSLQMVRHLLLRRCPRQNSLTNYE